MNAASGQAGAIVNAMTVDVEDYFQVSAFENLILRADWPRWPQRVEGNTERVLDLLGRHGIRATFFVLGWVAEHAPALVRRIADAGHEIASHGVAHERLTMLDRMQFRASIVRSKDVLEQLAGMEVSGYRAPSYSIGITTLWAYEELQRAGYRYSSSIVPIHHDLYGMPAAPRFAFRTQPTGLLEIPVTTVQFLGRNWPCGGGGYFRLLPYPLFKLGWHRVNRRERRPGVFYFHPWEIDPGQPRVPGVAFKNRVRHYLNLAHTEVRLERLMRDFRFDRMDRVFADTCHDRYPVVALRDTALCAH